MSQAPPSAAELARHYSRFRVTERVLLTGHSHQAWPDVALEAQQRAWLEAAELVDDKWCAAFAVAEEVRAGFARLLDDPTSQIVLGQSTHELVARFLSALRLRERPRLVTTDAEFHTIRRLLDRLAEEGIEVVRVAADGVDAGSGEEAIAERLVGAVDDRTAAVLVSSVLFRDARIVGGLDRVARAAERVGAALLVDAYHSLGALPFSVPGQGLEEAYIVGGGYKYLQLGEGNCFLRIPPGCTLRPVLTGWFAEFGALAGNDGRRDSPGGGEAALVPYAEGHARFAGSTYDPVSHYRAWAVMRFFRQQGLTPERLRTISLGQIRRLAAGFDALGLDPGLLKRDRTLPLEKRGGFLVLEAPGRRLAASELCRALRERGVWTDHRGSLVRLGPAPYVVESQLDDAVAAISDVVRSLGT